ncbi:MAG: hypothetical protein WDZ28_02285 [Simkaniaceae bacterium]
MGHQEKTILIITSSGGSGHLQAAKAKHLEIIKQNPSAKVIVVDILLDWIGKRIGRFFVNQWNQAQAEGNVSKLNRLISLQILQDFFFSTPIFFKTLFLLKQHKINHIIDTQPSLTSPIIKAIKWVEKKENRKIKFEKILTELPTHYCFHFFDPIKNLSKKDKNTLRLVTSQPLLYPNQTQEAFWRDFCNLETENIDYQEMPLRPTFKSLIQTKPLRAFLNLPIQFHSEEEKELIRETLQKGHLTFLIEHEKIHITLSPDEKIFTLMLGSIPAEKKTLFYVNEIIETIKWESTKEKSYSLFVFCNDHVPRKRSLLKQVHDLVMKKQNFPINLTVIPMSFQDDSVIAPLYYWSHMTLTRSGGLTAMELLAIAQGQICIHSEAKDETKPNQGMPDWEYGNALYLQRKRGAKLLTTSCFGKQAKTLLLSEKSGCEKLNMLMKSLS